MMEPSLPARCDVVVIGAGIAGLTTAAMLSRAGLQTMVLEAARQPGGYLCSFRRNGFVFDPSVLWLNQCRPGGFLNRIHAYIGTDGPRYRTLKRIHRYHSAGGDYLLTSDPTEFRDHLIRDYPQEARGLTALFRDAERLGRHMRLLDNRLRSAATMSHGECLRHGLAMTRWVLPVIRYVTTPAARGLTRYFHTRALLDLFHSEGTLMSVLVPIGFASTGDFQAPPAGGCGRLVDWLCRKIGADGGLVRMNSPVQAVLVNDRHEATGVRLATGQSIAARYVVAACDAETLFTSMVPEKHIPARWRRRLREADLFYSCFCIYLGLDCTPASLGLNEEIVRLIDGSVPPQERTRGDARTTAITVLSPSFRDPTLAPPGKGTLIVQCPTYMEYADHWNTGPGLERGEAYRACKAAYAGILLDRVEAAMIPGLRQHIETMEAATPVTFQRYTGNRGGTIMGHRPTKKNIHAGLARIGTPVKRLLLGGQWAEYGGGVPMATKAAVNASLIILRDLRPTDFEKLKRVVDGTVG